MQRFNTFSALHKTLRTLLCDAANYLQQADFLNRDEKLAAVQKVINAAQVFNAYASSESEYLLAPLFAFEPGVTDVFYRAHATGLKQSAALHQQAVALCRAGTNADKQEAGQQLAAAFTRFKVFALNLMAKEDVLHPFLWRYFTDAELQELAKTISHTALPQKKPAPEVYESNVVMTPYAPVALYETDLCWPKAAALVN